MITRRIAWVLTVGLATAQPAGAQSLLFDATLSKALRHALTPPSRAALRDVSTNKACDGCEDRPGTVHLVADSPFLTDAWLAAHDYRGNNRNAKDGTVIADFWYDGVHRRIFTRSAVFHDVDDPADVRLGRAPGHYPNPPDFDMLLGEGTTVGQVGFDRWTHDGFSSYFAAMQGTIRDEQTGYLVFATAMGQAGVTRTGSRFAGDDLVRHVRLHPSGQLEVGFETPEDNRPDPLLLVRGAATTEGALTIQGLGGNVPHACTVRSATARGRDARVSCQPTELAISGGGRCERGDLKGSRPLQDGISPDGWEVRCGRSAQQTAYAVCCVQ
jgi:hypothetical protein